MDTQHSSNANSAIISSLESVDAEHNPFLYSVSKYVASHASQKLRILPENNQAVPNGTTTFIMPRLGYLCDMTISFGVNIDDSYVTTLPIAAPDGTAVTGAAVKYAGHPAVVPTGRGMLEMIERITWCNESREILSLSQNAILALYSDLSLENRIAFSKAVQCRCDPLQDSVSQSCGNGGGAGNKCPTSDASSGYITCHLPIMMCLSANPALFPNLSFLSNCQCKITWASSFTDKFGIVFTATGNSTTADPPPDPPVLVSVLGGTAKIPADANPITIEQSTVALTCDFISLPQELQSKSIEMNYGSGALSQLVWDCDDFPIQTAALPTYYDREWPTVSVPLQTTKAVSDLYIMAYIPKSELRADSYSAFHDSRMSLTAGLPVPVQSIGMSASGQQIIEQVPAEQLRYWGRRQMGGEQGGWWATSASTGGYQNRLSSIAVGNSLATDSKLDVECPQAANYDALNGGFVYKINLAALSSNKNFSSGMLSFRELSSAQLTVQLARPMTNATFANSKLVNGVDYPLLHPTASGNVPAYDGDTQPFLSDGADDLVHVHIAVIARTNSIVNTDSQAGRQTGLLSN